jgi:S-DNA-T family DNA segregation ATPase FtsK/SpoIIIE
MGTGAILLMGLGVLAVIFSYPIAGIITISGGAVLVGFSLIQNKWYNFFHSVKFCNADNEYPELLRQVKTDYGNDYIFSLPRGMNIDHFEKIKLSLEQYLNSKISIEYKDKTIIVKSSEVKLLERYSYKFVKTSHPMDLVIGYTATGMRTIRLDKHMLICGSTGWGKSVLENIIITNLILNNTSETIVVNLCDFSIKELGIYKNCNMVGRFVTERKGLNSLLEDLEKTCLGRLELFERSGVKDIDKYNMKNEKKLKYVVTFIDEFAQLDAKKDHDLFSMIQRLMALARATGIFFVICTQRPSIDILPGTIRANIDIRCCFHTTDESNSKIILDQAGAEKLTIKGRGLLRYNGGDLEEFQAMLLEEDEIEKLIKGAERELFMITERDKRIIEYLKTKEVDSKELHDKFFHEFTPQWANKRLKTLVDRGHIKRKKGVDDLFYVYYL